MQKATDTENRHSEIRLKTMTRDAHPSTRLNTRGTSRNAETEIHILIAWMVGMSQNIPCNQHAENAGEHQDHNQQCRKAQPSPEESSQVSDHKEPHTKSNDALCRLLPST